jgi:hypothetical protein
MIGYHYTTVPAWETIQREGMVPAPLRAHERDKFRESVPQLPDDAIWVWKEPLTDEQAYIVTLLIAELHQCYNLVLLEICYEEWGSASIACKDHQDDIIRLSCTFGAGRLQLPSLPIDLIICNVPAAAIKCIWRVNLLDMMRGRHGIHTNTKYADDRTELV